MLSCCWKESAIGSVWENSQQRMKPAQSLPAHTCVNLKITTATFASTAGQLVSFSGESPTTLLLLPARTTELRELFLLWRQTNKHISSVNTAMTTTGRQAGRKTNRQAKYRISELSAGRLVFFFPLKTLVRLILLLAM